jgi:hypothetical protein
LTSRASGMCERQGEHYRSHPDDIFPKCFHWTYSDSASGPRARPSELPFPHWGVPVAPS